MRPSRVHTFLAVAILVSATRAVKAQLPRTRNPAAAPADAPSGPAISRNPRFPYAGAWLGTRTMEIGSDEIRFRFNVVDDKYTGATLHPGGGRSPQNNLDATAAGLTWEQPNSGGGTWVFHVRLAGPDSMVGTLVLRDAPANLTPAPRGTLVLTRQPTDAGRDK